MNKNIHILFTDKPSKIAYYQESTSYNKPVLQLVSITSSDYKYQNIYITNDKEIKKRNWVLNIEENSIFKPSNDEIYDIKNSESKYYEYCKKVILTTDPELIKDGVQSIDDDFLQWFVKNPSCERIEIVKGIVKLNDDGQEYGFPDMSLFKIIIPKEELKQEKTFENVLDESLAKGKLILKELKEINRKQKTLEEAACKALGYYYKNWINTHSKDKSTQIYTEINNWCKGAKWQAERMYSEENMKNAFDSAREFNSLDGVVDVHIVLPMGGDMSDLQPLHFTFKEWFEQFKKK
jgi:hypothetical protein